VSIPKPPANGCDDWPRWVSELHRHLGLKTQFFLFGNVHDRFPIRVPVDPKDGGRGTETTYVFLRKFLHEFLSSCGYQLIVFYDVADGLDFKIRDDLSQEKAEQSKKLYNDCLERHRGSGGPSKFFRDLRTLLSDNQTPTAAVVEHAHLLARRPDDLSDQERLDFLHLAKSGRAAAKTKIGDATSNQILLVVAERINDLPAWLYLNNPLARTIHVERPTEGERRRFFELNFGRLPPPSGGSADRAGLIQTYADLTSGMMNRELECIVELSRREPIRADKAKEAVDRYKFGITVSPWQQLLDNKAKRGALEAAEEKLGKRVKGQRAAIRAVADIIKRASQGLSGAQHSSGSQRPKGVLFFAGPTGVGKTELAKSLAALLFGDDQMCVRFDMSEYGQSHSDQRLFGAPPGYVGYEQGGELTNRIKANPFCVLLFDEIEKAHPTILDKFLQILEDGRLTSGQGETVYFSESVIIFTSNKGVYKTVYNERGEPVKKEPIILPKSWKCSCGRYNHKKARPAKCAYCDSTAFSDEAEQTTPYTEVRDRILESLEDYFKTELGRPELFNRFGNNFVVFDYIRKDVVREIVERMFAAITGDLLKTREISLDLRGVLDFVVEEAGKNLELGGRGVGNLIETVIINPLARQLFDTSVPPKAEVTVKAVNKGDEKKGEYPYRLDLEVKCPPGDQAPR
jgi:ATP-dependent Clp protease ATP-binding subunit ClpA